MLRLFLLLILLSFPASAFAETTIAVVDVQAIMSQSKASQSLEKQVSAQKEKFLTDVTKHEQDFRDREKKLGEARTSMPKEDFAKQAKAFEEELIKFRSAAQSRKRVLDEATAKSLSEIRAKLYEVVEQLAEEKGFNLVISKQNVIVGAQSIDLTDETIKKLDEVLSSVTLNVEDK